MYYDHMKTKNTKPNVMKDMQANIIKLMQTEGDNWTKSWVEVGLPMNMKTKKHYKGGNVFNLNFVVIKNEWKCNQWATFKQWSDMGYKIKKGSKGSQVYYWELREKKVSWLTEGEKAKYLATKKLPTYLLQKFAFVFNGVQIEDFKFEAIKQHKPNVIIKGGDYTVETTVGNELAEVKIFPTVQGFSTTDIMNKVKENAKKNTE